MIFVSFVENSWFCARGGREPEGREAPLRGARALALPRAGRARAPRGARGGVFDVGARGIRVERVLASGASQSEVQRPSFAAV